ncbi:flagellar biosynthetic protein FlhB [Ameyamaea chiangmaiensis NBRC 103196]|uniref:EscU/YscU/HrcU family type III secretion system export apparatus switch protein n=1 Tax=Ameyamaea chiangmaiensis TaxID=442969 RepID=A0A850PG96_9PROT|nr:flagellar type III secretion system protein FlhB [Ameyamaea chiangmaiensis]MBS4075661.1 EscU/YscU/HrcU family type III secretion system export apparatus switch protein [Ameyamaea chiangmaiensis]NVN40912.1 EscU/YscU/HrcU family type III secretion system export apparatus switch protein [Ameyamaea chiangmaiensis]GBQ70609.1 flagellar biosynthetic protein FlhB [Ameyamaea chiangmaiensis NBRC 103196]
MAEGDQEDRTEAPTARRLAKAREDGDVAQSRELQMVAGFGGGVLALLTAVVLGTPRFTHDMIALFESIGSIELDVGSTLRLARTFGGAGLLLLLPVGLGALVATLGVGFAQTGFLIYPGGLTPKLEKLDPRRGLSRLFGLDGVMEGARSCVKFVAFGVVVWWLMHTVLRDVMREASLDVSQQMHIIMRHVLRAALAMIGLQGAIAGLDTLWVRWRRTSKLRMSRQDLKDEHRQSEGDPLVKGRLRQIRMRAARRRMMEAVPKASVIITNPTHYAVALSYEQGSGAAPRIVAKGVDDVAWRIREKAREHRIPIVPNPPVARALYAMPLDSEIPREHFRVVAGIIAYVMKQKREAAGRRL